MMLVPRHCEWKPEAHAIAADDLTGVAGRKTGQTIAWEDAKDWLLARSRGEHPPKPLQRVFEA